MAEKKEPKKKAQAPVERTRETNPVYQGEYTILDYNQEMAENKRTPAMREFWEKFSTLPPEEKARMDEIDRRAWEKYDGPTSWPESPIQELPRHRLRRITPLEYYASVYELKDDDAVDWRIKHIQELAEYYDEISKVWGRVQAAGKGPEFKETVEALNAQYSKTILHRRGLEEAWEGYLEFLGYRLDHPEGLDEVGVIDQSLDELNQEIDILRDIAKDDYAALGKDPEKKAARDFLEGRLPKAKFEAEYDCPYSYEDVIAKIYAKMKLSQAHGVTYYDNGDPDFSEPTDLEMALETGLWVLEYMRRPETSTQSMAKQHPFKKPKDHIVPRDHANAVIGTGKVLASYDNGVLDFLSTYRREKPGHPEITNHITIRRPDGKKITKKEQALAATIGTLYWEKNKDHIAKHEAHESVWVSENELLKIHTGKTDKECSLKQQKDLADMIEDMRGWTVTIDATDHFNRGPEHRDKMDSLIHDLIPEIPKEQRITGKFTHPELLIGLTIETVDARTGKRSTWYEILRFPMTVTYSMLMGQWERIDSSLRATPKIMEADLKPDVVKRLDALKGEKVNLWTEKPGGRYLYLSNSPELPAMMYSVTSWIERMTADKSKPWSDSPKMDLDEMRGEVWPDDYDSTQKGRQKQYIIKYLAYLMNNPKGKIADFEIISEGKTRARFAQLHIKNQPAKGTKPPTA